MIVGARGVSRTAAPVDLRSIHAEETNTSWGDVLAKKTMSVELSARTMSPEPFQTSYQTKVLTVYTYTHVTQRL